MNLPFSYNQFLEVFRTYNEAIWPIQLLAYILAFASIFAVFRIRKYNSQWVSIILAILWIWTGWVYHILFFSTINPAAYLFGGLFILEGLLIWISGRFGHNLHFAFKPGPLGWTGAALIFYAMIIYPVLGSLGGHAYPAAPMFGVSPCPLTIFTLGILLWSRPKLPLYLLIIPGLWSLVGFTAALQLQMWEDVGLLIAALAALPLLIFRNRKGRNAAVT